ncbi:hypothetical protein Csa_022750 [Cucumis sativus]|nr:hypothetical protein Csa_022750 [Cucumis sativus]
MKKGLFHKPSPSRDSRRKLDSSMSKEKGHAPMNTRSSSFESSSIGSLPHHNSDDSVFNPSDHLLPESEDIPETVASGDHNVSIRAPLSSPINDPNLSQPNPEDLVQASKLNVKSSKGLPVVTTKTGCQKLPLNIPSVPIDGISFHHEKNPQRWKYVVQQRIAYEGNVSNKYQSCVSVMDHISQAEFIANLPSNFDDPSSSNYQTIHVRGTQFNISPSLLRHIGTFGVKIPLALPRFFSSFLLHLQPDILTNLDAPSPIHAPYY